MRVRLKKMSMQNLAFICNILPDFRYEVGGQKREGLRKAPGLKTKRKSEERSIYYTGFNILV